MVNSIPSDAESGGRWFESQMSQLFRPYSIKTCLRHLALEGKTGSCNSRCKIYQLIPFYYKQVFPCSINKLQNGLVLTQVVFSTQFFATYGH